MVKDESIKSKNAQYDILTSDKIYEASHFKDLKTFYSTHNNGKELKEKALHREDELPERVREFA